MSFPPRPPLVPYGIAPGVVTMPMPTHVMVGAYGPGGRGALLPAPAGKAVIARGPTRNTNGAKESEGPPITVFIGNISSRAPDAMIRALLGACGPVLSWKRVSTFGFSEFASPEAALRCVRLLNNKQVADKQLLARTDGKMQALVDTYKTEQRSRLGPEAGGAGGDACYLDARQRALDEAAERRLAQIMRDYQDDINNYELLQKEEAISKTARVLEEADISEEKRDVIHREIGKFRESMKMVVGGRSWERRRASVLVASGSANARQSKKQRLWCVASGTPRMRRRNALKKNGSETRSASETRSVRRRASERESARRIATGIATGNANESENGSATRTEREQREIRIAGAGAHPGTRSDEKNATRSASGNGRSAIESGTESASGSGSGSERGRYASGSENARCASGSGSESESVSGSGSGSASASATESGRGSESGREGAAAARRTRAARRSWRRRAATRSGSRRKRARRKPPTRRGCATGRVASGARPRSTTRRRSASAAARRSASARPSASRSSSRTTTTSATTTNTTKVRSSSGGWARACARQRAMRASARVSCRSWMRCGTTSSAASRPTTPPPTPPSTRRNASRRSSTGRGCSST